MKYGEFNSRYAHAACSVHGHIVNWVCGGEADAKLSPRAERGRGGTPPPREAGRIDVAKQRIDAPLRDFAPSRVCGLSEGKLPLGT